MVFPPRILDFCDSIYVCLRLQFNLSEHIFLSKLLQVAGSGTEVFSWEDVQAYHVSLSFALLCFTDTFLQIEGKTLHQKDYDSLHGGDWELDP